MKLTEYTLKQLLVIKNGRDHKDIDDGPFPVYGSGGVMRYCASFIYDKPSILLPRKGSLDNIQFTNSPFWTVDTVYYTEVNKSITDPYYLFSYLRLLDLSNLDTGTGVPSMTFDSYYNIKVKLPSVETQTRIAKILQSIDRKIALNREVNRNLEAMARQLYDYWFVQFDFPDENGRPYKSSGGKMVWNEKLRREIPEGWIISTIGNIASLNISSLSKKDDLRELLYLDTSSLTENKIDTVQHIERDDAPSRAQRKVSKNTILYSTVRPRLKHFGILCNPPDNLIASTGFCTIDANNISYSFWLYLFLTEEKIIKNLSDIADTAVSSYPSIGPSDIEGLQVCLGNDGLMALFYEKVSALFEIIESNQNENNELQKQRDELLPLLMNGQVSVMPLATNCDLSHD